MVYRVMLSVIALFTLLVSSTQLGTPARSHQATIDHPTRTVARTSQRCGSPACEDAPQAWGENVRVAIQNANDIPSLQISLDLHVRDFVGGQGRLLAYAFDAATRQPWLMAGTTLPRAPNGQLVLRHDFTAERSVDLLHETLSIPLTKLDAAPDQLVFRLLVWDAETARTLWQGEEWYGVQPPGHRSTPTPTTTVVPGPTPRLLTSISPSPAFPTPEPEAGATREIGGVEMVYVPAGPFQMGIEDGDSDERPVHTVLLNGFWISRTEVTKAQYRPFVMMGGYQKRELWTEDGWDWRERHKVNQPECWDEEGWKQPDSPAVCVSWYEAVAYANWLSQETGLNIQLPSEAEWEKAARGTDGRIFPWGNEWDETKLSNFFDATVGRYSPDGDSPYGVADMLGSVYEWTRNIYKGYPYDAADGREDLEANDLRVIRGGDWNVVRGERLRCAFRNESDPHYRTSGIGFRVIFSPHSSGTDSIPEPWALVSGPHEVTPLRYFYLPFIKK